MDDKKVFEEKPAKDRPAIAEFYDWLLVRIRQNQKLENIKQSAEWCLKNPGMYSPFFIDYCVYIKTNYDKKEVIQF